MKFCILFVSFGNNIMHKILILQDCMHTMHTHRDREALAGFLSHTTRNTGPYQDGSI